MFKIVKQLSKTLKQAIKSRKIGLLVESFAVSHAHIHLVPINKENELNSGRAKKEDPKELSKIQEKIKFVI